MHVKKEDAAPEFKDMVNMRRLDKNREPRQNGFRGVWIHPGILRDPKLRHIDKLILAYVQGFSGGDGCFASNRTIAELLGSRPQSIQNRVSNMVKSGYLEKIGSHGHRKLYLGEKAK